MNTNEMLTVLRHLLSKLVSPLWRTVDEVDEDRFFSCEHGTEDIRHLRGSVVTQLCHDYGMIDDAVYFTNEQVLGGFLLKEGDIVNATAVRDRAEGGWRALRVEKSADAWEDEGKASLEADTLRLQPLIGTVTSYDGAGGYINQTTYFSRYTLSEGYAPMKGDWVHAKYFVNPTDWTTRAHSVAPLRYCRLDQVPVTGVFGNSGVVDDSVFFCLDSLLLPTHYQPLPGHMVNLVMLESSQALYSWRALCMAPCLVSVSSLSERPSDTKTHIILENKQDLDVSDYGQQFGELLIGERRYLVLWIQNKGSETHRLLYCDFAGWDSEEQFYLVTLKDSTLQKQASTENCPESQSVLDSFEKQENNDKALQKAVDVPGVRREERELDIQPGERVSVTIACQAKSLGICTEMLLLHFSSFTIGRRLEVTVSTEDVKRLQSSVPYTPTDVQPILTPTQVITNPAPKIAPRLSKRKMPHFLPRFAVPQSLKDCIEAQGDVLVFQPLLGEVLSPSNMHARFSTLLWLEELHAERELREFNISGALLRKGAAYLHLVVNGLAEGRPSLSIGDRIVLKKARSDGLVVEYISSVAEINDEEVSLRLNFEFQRNYLGEPLDVEFSYNRITMRRCHNALAQTKDFGDILFPSAVTLQTPQWSGKWIDETDQNKPGEDIKASGLDNENVLSVSIDMKSKATQTKDSRPQCKPIPSRGNFFNPELNPSQREAVKRILEGECRPTPYVLFGPPGTGKTITLIEAILQVYHYVPSSRVLVCTPSNSAADLICVRLHDSGFLDCGSLARVNASCRHIESIPDVLQRYSRAGEDIRQASFHRIVVSTCSSAGMFHNLGIHVGHFTHVFLDEAGQATEPESLIPISLVSEKHGQIVLAGDPCQLGPVIKSKVAVAFGLGVSLLERLMASPLYSRHDWGYNPKLVTKLNYNYRSHEALLKLPSKLFYQEELYCKAPSAVVESLCLWKKLPQKGLPLLFHGVRGTEMREGNNPSWFNPVEAVQVMLYCCQLAKKLHRPVNASDIGIIAPYKKQCEKIRMLLVKVGLSDIKVGSVEEFQGQEFLVIIMSTVRSNESMQNEDLQSSLGFLANPKRFNVAITRSKALLLIVGNPHILVKDLCFRALLQYCFINGAYLGCDPPPLLRESQIAEEDERSN